MMLIGYLNIPDKDKELIQSYWDDGDITAIREYADNHSYWDIEVVDG